MNSHKLKSLSIKLFKEAIENGAKQYEAAKALGISLRSMKRWQKSVKDKRTKSKNNPHNKLSNKERKKIIKTSCSNRFKDLSPNVIVPILAAEGEYIGSEATFYRILRDEKLLKHRTNCKPKKRHKPRELKASGPNQVWSWDISYIKSNIKGEFFYLYLIMDVWSRAIVGWAIHDRQCENLAAKLFEKTCRLHHVTNVFLHSDNGGPMKGATMLATLERLGVIPSFSRPSVSNDNPYSESLFKTVKYNVCYPPNNFDNVEKAQQWFCKFEYWYNEEHLHSGIKFVTPMQRQQGKDIKILEKRKETYLKAKAKNPKRWSGKIRNWDRIDFVYLNPCKSTLKTQYAL